MVNGEATLSGRGGPGPLMLPRAGCCESSAHLAPSQCSGPVSLLRHLSLDSMASLGELVLPIGTQSMKEIEHSASQGKSIE